MAIPAIQPYQMPTASDMPQNKVSWVPDPNRAVLLIHDMQNYFVDAFTAGASPVTELSANIRKLKNQCVHFGIPVVYTAQPGSQNPDDRALLTDFWGPGLNSGPYEEKIITELAPEDDDLVLTKWRYSAFKRTNLLEMMRKEGRDQLIITGIYAHIGCLVTACEAFMEDIKAFFVGDAVADFSLEKHQMALDYAAGRCAFTVMTDSLLDQLQNAPADVQKTSANTGKKNVFTCENIRKQIAELLQETSEDITDQEDLLDRGLDSVRIMTLVEQWRREGAEVTFVELAERPTIEEWQKLLTTRSQQVLPNADYL
ncbi:isochorismatase [Bacillus subtilis]|uniref:isochorismatase family protein n=1 Tax=Bacillus TaxID=1386 RepID=UPI0005A437D3|nr:MULTISPECIES: isochorismatase [Bacillus]MBW4824897.1 isochorismatase [Bacillaceae bacterium]AJO59576.1 Isochorismatase [Bacillus sp. YP1]ASC00772.1 isochorismatase [Bacillus subtilis]AXF34486.1 isochorismatase [Bacillus sp. DM2]AYF12657.1 isochorismatase [Bacillus subtilis]